VFIWFYAQSKECYIRSILSQQGSGLRLFAEERGEFDIADQAEITMHYYRMGNGKTMRFQR
jgi:hypothetical protein